MTNQTALFKKSLTCPACSENYKTTAVLSSKIRKKSTHSDFYVEYIGPNPNYYLVHVCPVCGYAYFKKSKQLTKAHKKLLEDKISQNFKNRDYTGERTPEDALAAYKLALLCGQLVEEKDNVIAGIVMHIVWLYREVGDEANEQRFLKHAYDLYEKIYLNATFEVNVPKTLYILGEICRQLGDYHNALIWYSRIIEDKKIADATMIKLSREQYMEVRQLQKQTK